MTAPDKPIQEEVNRALNIFRDSFHDFAVRKLRTARGRKPAEIILASLRGQAYNNAVAVQKRGGDIRNMFDVGEFFFIVRDNWQESFADDFQGDRSVLSALSQIGSARNAASHSQYGRDIARESAMSRVADMLTILGATNDADAQAAVQAIWDGLDKMSAAPAPAPVPDAPPDAPQPASPDSPKPKPAARNGRRAPLKAWREVIQPRDDVIGGNASQDRFAASLSDVYSGRADRDYADPFAFFRRTYLTGGIETLLVNALRRLSGNGGEPVIQTKTVFGGGKTHSLIALYHLIDSGDALINPRPDADPEDIRVSADIREIMRKAGVAPESGIPGKAAVIDCNEITATTTEKTAAGDPLNTLWGVIAYQLGGQPAYDIIADAARAWTAPGAAELRALFAQTAPCVILIDELVAYARNIPDDDKLGRFYSFIQYLTEAARQSDGVALVITLPESEIEAGSEIGAATLARVNELAVLENLTARVEAVWHPLEVSETFKVIRRRLFADDIDEAERDRTCDAFADMYRQRRADYPPEAAEARYRERMKRCYPIHPEFFDRIFADWSSDPRFQRTRGVLRVMAAAVARLHNRDDRSPLIMPGDAPLYDDAVSQQFVRLLGDNWGPALQEIDSDGGKLEEIDRQTSSLNRIGASRRLARAIFFGSKPGATVGATRDRLNLAVVRPGEGASIYGDALERMTGSLYYLYEQDGRRYFHNEENLNRLAANRARELAETQVHAGIIDLLRQALPPARRRDVVLCPSDSAAVPDDPRARLIVLPPAQTVPSRKSEIGDDRDAEAFVRDTLQNRGRGVRRIRKNSLVFLAARRDNMRDLDRKTREFLAWESIVSPAIQRLPLTGERRNQAVRSMDAAKSAMDAALQSTYVHILAPEQPDGAIAEFHIAHHRTAPSRSGEIIQAAFETLRDEDLLLNDMPPATLLSEIDGAVWHKDDDHIGVNALWNSLANYVHSPFRLADIDVLIDCLTEGVRDGVFGIADETEGRDGDLYPNLRIAEPIDRVAQTAIIVRQEMANMVMEERNKQAGKQSETQVSDTTQSETITGNTETTTITPPQPPLPTRIAVSKTLDRNNYMVDIGMISGEIVRTLLEAGEGVELTIQITARKPDGFPEQTTRPTRENAAQLGLEYKEE